MAIKALDVVSLCQETFIGIYNFDFAIFEVFTVVKIQFFHVVVLCSVVVGYQCIGGLCYFHGCHIGSTVLQIVVIQPPHYMAQHKNHKL
jgi:hypothetical protein